jgi:hypothetical protein
MYVCMYVCMYLPVCLSVYQAKAHYEEVVVKTLLEKKAGQQLYP